MTITDTHTHLYSEAFEEDRAEVIRRALDAGISRLLIAALDSTYAPAMFDLEREHPENVFLMTGLHPTHVKGDYREELAVGAQELARRSDVAVGEIGIDLCYDKSTVGLQQEAF